MCLAVDELRDVIRGDAVDEGDRVAPLDPDLAHVRHVEQAGSGSGRHVLFDDAGFVLNGHLPSAEVDHLPAESFMHFVQRSFLKVFRGHNVGIQCMLTPRAGVCQRNAKLAGLIG